MAKTLRFSVLFGFFALLSSTQVSHPFFAETVSFLKAHFPLIISTKHVQEWQLASKNGRDGARQLKQQFQTDYQKLSIIALTALGIIISQNTYLQRNNIRAAYRSLTRVFKRTQSTDGQKAEKI